MNAPCSKLNRLRRQIVDGKEVMIPELTPRLAFKKMNKFGIPCYDHHTARWYQMSTTNPNNIKAGKLERYSDKEGKFIPCDFQWETIIEGGIWYQGAYKEQKKVKPTKPKRITKSIVLKFLAEAKKQLGNELIKAIKLVVDTEPIQDIVTTATQEIQPLKSDVITRKPFSKQVAHV